MTSVMQLLVGREGEYPRSEGCGARSLSGPAVPPGCVSRGDDEAFVEFADRFDPDELTASFDGPSIDRKPIFKFMPCSQVLAALLRLVPDPDRERRRRFPQMFAEEFVKAYERQINEYKRLESQRTESCRNSESRTSRQPASTKRSRRIAMEALKETGSTELLRLSSPAKRKSPPGAENSTTSKILHELEMNSTTSMTSNPTHDTVVFDSDDDFRRRRRPRPKADA